MSKRNATGRNAKLDKKVLGRAVKVASGSVAAGLIATGSSADAEIVVIEVDDTLFADLSGEHIQGYDLDGSGSNDLTVEISDFGERIDLRSTVGLVTDQFLNVTALNSGDLIDAISSFVGSEGAARGILFTFDDYETFSQPFGPYYAGFQFNHQTFGDIFAWADLAVAFDQSRRGFDVQVNRFAFETSGGSIFAGATSVPEPSAFGLLAIGAAAVATRRRRTAVTK